MESHKLLDLLLELAKLPAETEWVEFKHNYQDPEQIGRNLSAIANSSALERRDRGFIVWGLEDGTHALLGTAFRMSATKVGNEQLENWLNRLLSPALHFKVHEGDSEAGHFVVLEVPPAQHTPVRFKDFEYVRVGSNTRKLRDQPERERGLWRLFESTGFEEGHATVEQARSEVLTALNYAAYFDLLGEPLPERHTVIGRFVQERFLIETERPGYFNITNLGAILFAKRLQDFPNLRRKVVRVVVYRDVDRTDARREQEEGAGYAAGFVKLIEFIHTYVPTNEVIGQALRREVLVYPLIAIRELVANALIHQDFTITGSGPMIEIFQDRMEITNPGVPLIETERFLDSPPRSRNDLVASFMRRVKICEERGSGIDKVVAQAELFQLPAPDFRVTEGHTRAILFAPQPFAHMGRADRVRACYQHAALLWISNRRMTNATLRARFGPGEITSTQASRIIRDTVRERLIKRLDPTNSAPGQRNYVPYWA